MYSLVIAAVTTVRTTSTTMIIVRMELSAQLMVLEGVVLTTEIMKITVSIMVMIILELIRIGVRVVRVTEIAKA